MSSYLCYMTTKPGQCSVARLRLALKPAFFRWKVRDTCNTLCFGSKIFVLDALPEPARVITLPQVIDPRVRIDSFGQLHEKAEILSAELQFLFRALKVKTLLRCQFTLGVFPNMTPPFGFGSSTCET